MAFEKVLDSCFLRLEVIMISKNEYHVLLFHFFEQFRILPESVLFPLVSHQLWHHFWGPSFPHDVMPLWQEFSGLYIHSLYVESIFLECECAVTTALIKRPCKGMGICGVQCTWTWRLEWFSPRKQGHCPCVKVQCRSPSCGLMAYGLTNGATLQLSFLLFHVVSLLEGQ